MNSLGFNATSNIQYAYPYLSAISSQYVVPPQNMQINERIGYDDANYSANYSQFSYDARYANRTNVLPTNSASYANGSAHNSASYVSNMFLITMAELMKIQQGIQVLMLMIRPHMLLIITMAKSMKILKDMLVLKLMIRLLMLLKTTSSGPFYLAQVRMRRSPKLNFDHSFALYYIIYAYKLIIIG
jgi:hypothetical protein